MKAILHNERQHAAGAILLRPSDNGPLNFPLTLRRYQAFGEDAANVFDGVTFQKAFSLDGRLHLLSLTDGAGGPLLRVQSTARRERIWQEAERIASQLLGLNFDLNAFYAMAQSDPILRAVTTKLRGLRPTLSSDRFEMLITSITAQQINLKFAFTVRSRLIRRYGAPLVYHGKNYFAFPTPEKLSRARVATLRRLQFTQRKAEYIIALARRICDGRLQLALLQNLSEQEIHEQLTQSRGLGRWTVDWFLARGLGRGNAFPAGDLGVAKAVQHFYFNDKPQLEEALRDFAERWGDFRNLAVHYLLAAYYFQKPKLIRSNGKHWAQT
jgi:DNA-3-methyladenine glycosylase II